MRYVAADITRLERPPVGLDIIGEGAWPLARQLFSLCHIFNKQVREEVCVITTTQSVRRCLKLKVVFKKIIKFVLIKFISSGNDQSAHFFKAFVTLVNIHFIMVVSIKADVFIFLEIKTQQI